MVVVTTGTGGAHKIYLISGKQSAGSGAADGRFSRSVSVVLPSPGNQASSDTDSQGSGPPQRKRQRLTHLSPEEKSLRRKLKNRVAAQTARDRKKAKMGELEQQVSELELENQKLHLENKLLREKTKSLMNENQEFRQRLGLDTLGVQEKFQNVPSSVDALSVVIGSSESAALRLRVPLQKVQAQHSSKLRSSNWMCAVTALQILSSQSDLLGILDILDPELLLRCGSLDQEAVPELGGVESDPVSAPSHTDVGAPPTRLEGPNELIHWDHIYTRPVEVEQEATAEQSEESDPEVKMGGERDLEAEPSVEMLSVKEEPEEKDLISPLSQGDLLSPGGPEEGCYLSELYSDSEYERSPSPFGSMSSPLWDDIFASELFPQLISV
ncbi:X-box-binding protein 1-like [Brienomyrus brachyistius]|uniref:X-box-binding protein 1-like n=1 Tax=Brienomyrus brachyistius TaxID=42636 RepID=UPI0020B1C797|nr:X-box-binding protein 1-like [Brienomyrus brachyistius]